MLESHAAARLGEHLDVPSYAGAWRRIAGQIVDRCLAMALVAVCDRVGQLEGRESLGALVGWAVAEVGCIAILGQTPGCALLGFRVEALDGGPVGLRRALVRTGFWLALTALCVLATALHPALLLPSVWAVLATDIAGYILVAARTDKRHLMDLAAGTVVARVLGGKPYAALGLCAVPFMAVALGVNLLAPYSLGCHVQSSAAMEPTLAPNDRFVAIHYATPAWSPTYGDVVLYTSRSYRFADDTPSVGRVVGMAGDVLWAEADGHLYRNDARLEEPYVSPLARTEWPTHWRYRPRVKARELVILGDNREDANDSRSFGAIPQEDVIAKALIVYWPLGHAKRLEVTE